MTRKNKNQKKNGQEGGISAGKGGESLKEERTFYGGREEEIGRNNGGNRGVKRPRKVKKASVRHVSEEQDAAAHEPSGGGGGGGKPVLKKTEYGKNWKKRKRADAACRQHPLAKTRLGNS